MSKANTHFLFAIRCALLALCVPAVSFATDSLEVSVARGAEVFEQRCALCHGNDGMGGGLLPLTAA